MKLRPPSSKRTDHRCPNTTLIHSRAQIVTGTDTGVGKTIVAAGVAGMLGGWYWKPVQAGTEEGTDSETTAHLSGLPRERILPEAYRLATPASPHLAARIDGVEIDPARPALPAVDGPLVVEGAGGAPVPPPAATGRASCRERVCQYV